MKEVKVWQKRSTTVGDWNKKRVFDIIFRSFTEGVSFTELIKQTGLSRPTVSRCVKDLENEDKIQNVKQKYFIRRLFEDDGLSLYGIFFEFFGSGPMFLRNPPGEPELGPHWDTEEFISEFSKRIGRYISYVFIEALRQQRTLKPIQLRSQIASDFVRQSIPLDSFLAIFRDTVPKEKEDRSSNRWELGPNTYYRINSAYHKVYPQLWEFIEKELSEFIDSNVENYSPDELRNKCDHTWSRIYIAKKGEYHTCKKCPAIVKHLANN